MPPAIYLSLGPSGAGKDTLLMAAQKLLASHKNVVFVKRHITRDPSKITDLEIAVTSTEFDEFHKAGEYALNWQAHDTKYAIRHAELNAELAAGKRCVLNVSRTQIPIVLERYSERCEVYVLNITATPETLRARLQDRGRESAESVEQRLARALQDVPTGEFVITVLNEGTIEAGAERVARALAGTLKYTLWLVPAADGALSKWACASIEKLTASVGLRPFPPHVTLCPSYEGTQRDAVAKARAAAAALAPTPIALQPTHITHSSSSKRAVAMELERKPTLMAASAAATGSIFPDEHPSRTASFEPHLSLCYGEYAEAKREALLAEVANWAQAIGEQSECAGRLELMCTTGSDYTCWVPVQLDLPLST